MIRIIANTTLCLILGCSMMAANADNRVIDSSMESIQERLSPVGKGQVSIDAVQKTAVVTNSAAAGARSGADIYQSACVACHAAGIAGAPKLDDKAAWKPRVAQGMTTLLKHVSEGFNAMPPKGTCMTCSADDLKAAIEYMINQ